MLILQRIEIENFVCFDSIVVEPSSDRERPLTVIRAENGSGKTTLLRALRWGLYGEKGLPGTATSRFPVHPASWQPAREGIETCVSIEFVADGSSRHHADTDNRAELYRLGRTVKTIAVETDRDDDPDFRRIEERAILLRRELDGIWNPVGGGPDAVIAELLPWDLRDFFVMDADEATDFVGGSENKMIPRKEVQEKTTHAVSSLLGIGVFKSASGRVEDLAREFSKRATRAIGDQSLIELEEQREQAQTKREELDSKISGEEDRQADLSDRLEQLDEDLEVQLRLSGAHDDLEVRHKRNREDYAGEVKRRADCAARLGDLLESSDLLASLASSAVDCTYDYLKPLHDQGRIPANHLSFVQSLMDSGRCVCGQTLTDHNEHGLLVKERISEAADEAERAGYLSQLHDAARSLKLEVERSSWNERRETAGAEFSQLDSKISDLLTEKKDIDAKLKLIEDSDIHLIREEKGAVDQQLDACKANLVRDRSRLEELDEQIASLNKTIPQRQRNENAAADLRASERLSRWVVEIVNNAYTAIEQKQVKDLSKRMDSLFQQMAANVSDDDFDESQPNKATLRMISRVGVRPIEGSRDKFEIFALNNRDRYMPPVQINGASRRVLALSFVLALCTESQTRAPLVADSLLNFMSGAVRRNTLRITAEHATQPILLLTGADLESFSEIEIVAERAGATYTLTGQWDAVEAGSGGDVVNWTRQRQISLLCGCGPRQYCRVCERVGQAGAPGWTGRSD